MITAPPAGRFAFFPLHMAPESSVDTWAPFYQDQLAFAAQVALAMPADVEFVVKLHFSDPDNYSRSRLQALLRLPGVRIAHPGAPGREFIDRATLVVGIQGTASLEAALLGKPVLMFGASPYLPFPRTQRAKRPDELHEQILGMLSAPPPTESEIVEAYSRYIAQFMPGRVNDWARPLEPEHHERFANCFRRLLDHIDQADRRARWYDCPPFAGSGADSGSGDGRSIASAGW
jgi:capsule polysaccharide modification protein KpsS